MHKRFFAVLLIIFYLLFSSCNCSKNEQEVFLSKIETDGLYVVYIDVGEGDATFIRLPDGKSLLIDTGMNDTDGKNLKKVQDVLDVFSVKSLDYLVLTHTDSDHTGNAKEIIEKYSPKTAYVPYVKNKDKFEIFSESYTALEEVKTDIKISAMFEKIESENYFTCFLSPKPYEMTDSEYDGINKAEPTDKEINNASAVIFLEYKNVRFIFLGDSEEETQETIIQNINAEYYTKFNDKIDLENIDFFKVPHHGASDAVCKDFWKYLNTKNAIISSGIDNLYGHPSDNALQTLQGINENYNLYRTDTDGSISVYVGEENYTVKTESGKEISAPIVA